MNDEAHSQICRADAGQTPARPAHERGWPALRDVGSRWGYPDAMPQAIKLIDAEGRSCIYVPITQNGKVVDSQGFMLNPEDERPCPA